MSVRVRNWTGDISYLGPSKAIITDNKDPNQKGRVRVISPVYGESPWIAYIYPEDGFFSPPDIGSVVYIECDGGDPNHLIIRGTVNDGDDLDQDTPTEFRRDVPTNRGWSSPGNLSSIGEPVSLNAGHILELDDGIAILNNGTVTHTAESRGVRLTTSGGHSVKLLEENTDGQQLNRIQASSTGGHSIGLIDESDKSSGFQRIQLSTTGGQIIQMVDDADTAKQNITIKDADERTIEVIKESDRIRIRNQSGTIFIDIDFANDTIEIDANNVKLGTGAAESIVRGDTFKVLFDSHYHQTGAGPSSPPVVKMDSPSANTHLSNLHKVE